MMTSNLAFDSSDSQPGLSDPAPNPQRLISSPLPPVLDVRTVVVLFHHDHLLLLKRAEWKKIAPGRWTGLGGKVEADEFNDLTASARRELFEETDLASHEVSDLQLRRILTVTYPSVGIVMLLYYTGRALTDRLPTCNEGTLTWVTPADLSSLDLIENTAEVIPLLIEDARRDPEEARCGIARHGAEGRFEGVIFE